MKSLLAYLLLFVLLGGGILFVNKSIGIGGFGPTKNDTVTVTRLYVDFSGSKDNKESHYMVGTDKGVFEVDNGLLLRVWNADEIYAKLKEGKTYHITTKGNKVANWFFQEYPYIVKATPAD